MVLPIESPCPNCGSVKFSVEKGEFALVKIPNDKPIDLLKLSFLPFVVIVCSQCGLVQLFRKPKPSD